MQLKEVAKWSTALDCKSIDNLSSRVQISPSLFLMIFISNRKFSKLLKISYIKSTLVLQLMHILLYKKKYIQFLTSYVSAGFEVVYICSNKWLYPTINFLTKHSLFLFTSVIDVVCYDLPQKLYRFSLVYVLFSIKYSSKIYVVTRIQEDVSRLLSIVSLFRSVQWSEREVFDFFGVFFNFNTDLRRILTDYGFKGFPLRKDFPLSGYIEVKYDENKKRIVTESIELSQEFRTFNFKTPW